MEREIIIIAVFVLALLVVWFYDCKECRARKEVERQKEEVERQKEEVERQKAKVINQKAEAEHRKKQEGIEACKKADIDKLMDLLEKGLNPNTTVVVWVDEYYEGEDCSDYKTRTLLDISSSPAVIKLLRSYGAKTTQEIREEEAEKKKARFAAKKAERMRQEAILQARKKAKEEADMRKVEAFLASKKA